MAYGGSHVNPNKIDHATALLNHIDRISIANSTLFLKEFEGGFIKGALPRTKMENYFGMICRLETLLINQVCDVKCPTRIIEPKEKYKVRRDSLKARFRSALNNADLVPAFDLVNEWEQILMIEANNAGLLMRTIVTEDLPVEESSADSDA